MTETIDVGGWVSSVPIACLFVTATTIAEIEHGVFRRERLDSVQGRVLRRRSREHVLPSFAARVLCFDLPSARVLTNHRVPGHAPLVDALIAGIMTHNEMVVVAGTMQNFGLFDCSCLNPWV